MRRLIAYAGAVAALGCASIGAPPGGPTRTTPPVLLAVSPDSGAVNVRADAVVFAFDAVVSDRPVGQRSLEATFIISPAEGEPEVRWRRDRIEVRPRRGFRDSTAYAVTMLPGVSDLRGNVNRTPRTIVFSTGPSIPGFAIHGRVFDWMGQRPAPNAVVEAIRRPDSLPYVGILDSAGQFSIGPLREGRYTVRAFIDANTNRAQDPAESWDSLSVLVQGTSPFVELLAAPRDTVPPRLLTVTVGDSVTLAASFDRPLDPAVPLVPERFQVLAADSTPLRVIRVRTRAEVAEAAAARDSVRADSVARTDTTPPAPTAVVPRPRPPVPGITVRPSRPAPPREIVITLDSLTPLRAGEAYRVVARNMRGLLGTVRTSERVVNVPRAPSDTTGTVRPSPPSP